MRTLALALLAGCAPVTNDVIPYAAPAPTCDTTISRTVPLDGATDHYNRAPIEFHLSEPDPTAMVIANFDGIQSTRDEGRVVVFTPTEPLLPYTTYTAVLDYCTGAPSIGFTTSGYGQEMDVPVSELEGTTWVVEVADAVFPAGPNLSDLVASIFSDRLLISLAQVNEEGVVLRVALPQDDVFPAKQDECMRTLDLPATVITEAPFFEVSAQNLVMDANAGEIRLLDLRLAGTMSADGSSVGGAELSVTIDAQDLVDALGLFDEETLCDLADGLGAPCGACPDGDGGSCVRVDVTNIEALAEPNLVLVPVYVPEALSEC